MITIQLMVIRGRKTLCGTIRLSGAAPHGREFFFWLGTVNAELSLVVVEIGRLGDFVEFNLPWGKSIQDLQGVDIDEQMLYFLISGQLKGVIRKNKAGASNSLPQETMETVSFPKNVEERMNMFLA